MARLDRRKRSKSPEAKKKKPARVTVKTVYKLLILNLFLTVMNYVADYEKYAELFNKLKNLLGY